MKAIQAKVWNLQTQELVTETVTGEAGVITLSERMLKDFSGKDFLPGFELATDSEAQGTLAVAVAPFGWALIHTAQDQVTQHCTYAPESTEAASVDVQWDEVTAVPRKWFVTQSQALAGIRQWLEDGTLSPAVKWSDDCS